MDQEGIVCMDHEELMALTSKTLNALLESDPVLCDLPKGVTEDEVSAQLALEAGQSITVYITKETGEEMPIVVPLEATVIDLKKALKRFMSLKLKRREDDTNISWRYIWRTYWLTNGSVKLSNNLAPLSEYGVSNKSKLFFRKKRRGKNVP